MILNLYGNLRKLAQTHIIKLGKIWAEGTTFPHLSIWTDSAQDPEGR